MKFKLITNKCPVCGEKMKFSKEYRRGKSLSYKRWKPLFNSDCIRCSACDTMIATDIKLGPIIIILGFYLSVLCSIILSILCYKLFNLDTVLVAFPVYAWVLFVSLRSACICPKPRNYYRYISIEEATEIWQKKKGEWLKNQKALREEQKVDGVEAAKKRMFEFRDARRECEICGGRLKINPFLDGILPFEDDQFCSKKCETCGTKFLKKPSVSFWIALALGVIHITVNIATKRNVLLTTFAHIYILYNFYGNSPFEPYDKGFLDIKALKAKWKDKNQ